MSESEIEKQLHALSDFAAVWRSFVEQMVAAFKPILDHLALIAGILFGDYRPRAGEPEVFLYAAMAGMRSHTVWVCPKFEWWDTDAVGPSDRLLWVMLNPSRADEERDDPTVRCVMRYSREWGYGGCMIVNLFTMITPNPARLIAAVRDGSYQHRYDYVLRDSLHDRRGGTAVVAWGANVSHPLLRSARPRVELWAQEFDVGLYCLGMTKAGEPLHPGRLARGLQLQPWKGVDA